MIVPKKQCGVEDENRICAWHDYFVLWIAHEDERGGAVAMENATLGVHDDVCTMLDGCLRLCPSIQLL